MPDANFSGHHLIILRRANYHAKISINLAVQRAFEPASLVATRLREYSGIWQIPAPGLIH